MLVIFVRSARSLLCVSTLNAEVAPFVVKKRTADFAFPHVSEVSIPSSVNVGRRLSRRQKLCL